MPPKTSTARGRSQHRESNESEEPFHPSADAATFRDLLIFEERLKQNAARLQARKRKYEILLFGFVTFILGLSHLVVVSPRSSIFLQYSLAAVLLICLTTLFLFFASGMHAERIRSANKFVPQANRSLRNFNMYLNTRTTRRTTLSSSSSIPPAQNSRGELIFSSKVSPEFRQGYERYRAAFERRRAEKIAAKRAQSWKRWFDFALGRSYDHPTRPIAAETSFAGPRARSSRSSKRSTPSARDATLPGSHGATPSEDVNEEALSDDGSPPSVGSSSMSGHEQS